MAQDTTRTNPIYRFHRGDKHSFPVIMSGGPGSIPPRPVVGGPDSIPRAPTMPRQIPHYHAPRIPTLANVVNTPIRSVIR